MNQSVLGLKRKPAGALVPPSPPKTSSKHQKCQFPSCTKFARRGGDNKFCTKHLPKHLKRWCVVCKHHLAQYAGSRCSKCAGKKRNTGSSAIGAPLPSREGVATPVIGFPASKSLVNKLPLVSTSTVMKADFGGISSVFIGDFPRASNSDIMEALDFLVSISDEECDKILSTKAEQTSFADISLEVDGSSFLVDSQDSRSFSSEFEFGMLFESGSPTGRLLLAA